MIKILRHLAIALSTLLMVSPACAAETNDDVEATEDLQTTSDDAVAAASPAAQPAMTEEQRRTIENFQQLIKRLQGTGGVYQVQLSEVLLSLGNTYQSMDQHKDAITAFERSLHISRVNDGLYSLSQVAVLEEMIESNTRLGDWESLDRNYHNLYWISKRHHGDNSPELLELIDRIGRWHLKAYELQPGPEGFSHLLLAEQLYNKAVAIIEAENGENDIKLINALYGIALTNYQIAAEISNATDFSDIRAGYRDANTARRMLQEERARQDLLAHSYGKGKAAMQRIVGIYAANPVIPVDMQALALTHLGDWYLLFNKRDSAGRTYERAYQLLAGEDINETKLEMIFGQPITLPAIRLPVQNEVEMASENPAYVLASFDVSASGKARNIQILESNPADNESYQRRARRNIASTRFRPRYEDGKPVVTTGVNLRYVFPE